MIIKTALGEPLLGSGSAAASSGCTGIAVISFGSEDERAGLAEARSVAGASRRSFENLDRQAGRANESRRAKIERTVRSFVRLHARSTSLLPSGRCRRCWRASRQRRCDAGATESPVFRWVCETPASLSRSSYNVFSPSLDGARRHYPEGDAERYCYSRFLRLTREIILPVPALYFYPDVTVFYSHSSSSARGLIILLCI